MILENNTSLRFFITKIIFKKQKLYNIYLFVRPRISKCEKKEHINDYEVLQFDLPTSFLYMFSKKQRKRTKLELVLYFEMIQMHLLYLYLKLKNRNEDILQIRL